MTHVTVLGAGITGITTAYALLDRGCQVTIIDRNRYPAMETSFANGGQLSACNAEVWNSFATVMKGAKWIFKKDAPLLLNPSPSWHKYSWLAEFVAAIGGYRENTIATTRLAIAARQHLFDMAARENIDFDVQRRGILHVYRDAAGFAHASKVNALLVEGGLDRRAVTPDPCPLTPPSARRRDEGRAGECLDRPAARRRCADRSRAWTVRGALNAAERAVSMG